MKTKYITPQTITYNIPLSTIIATSVNSTDSNEIIDNLRVDPQDTHRISSDTNVW